MGCIFLVLPQPIEALAEGGGWGLSFRTDGIVPVTEIVEEFAAQCPHGFDWGHFWPRLIHRPTTASGTTLPAAATLACARAASRFRSAPRV